MVDLLSLTVFPSAFNLNTRSNQDQNSSLHLAHTLYLSKAWTEIAALGRYMLAVCMHSVLVVCVCLAVAKVKQRFITLCIGFREELPSAVQVKCV